MIDLIPFKFSGNWTHYSQGRVILNGASSWKSWLAALYLDIFIYSVWRERNHIVHNQSGYSSSAHSSVRL